MLSAALFSKDSAFQKNKLERPKLKLTDNLEDLSEFKKVYTILGMIGQGAHSIIYKVEKKSDKGLFAAKMTKCFDEEIL